MSQDAKGFDERLLEILVCPNCHGPLSYRQEQQRLLCLGECRYEYPIVDGLAQMLVSEAVKPTS